MAIHRATLPSLSNSFIRVFLRSPSISVSWGRSSLPTVARGVGMGLGRPPLRQKRRVLFGGGGLASGEARAVKLLLCDRMRPGEVYPPVPPIAALFLQAEGSVVGGRERQGLENLARGLK